MTPERSIQGINGLTDTTSGRVVLWLNGTLVHAPIETIGLAYQPLDSDLTAISALTTAAYGRGLLTLANAAALAAEVDSAFLTPAEGNAAYQPLDADLTSWAGVTRAAGIDTFIATPSSANLAAAVTGETGTGALVFGTAPTITEATLTGLTGYAIAGLIWGLTLSNDPTDATNDIGIAIGSAASIDTVPVLMTLASALIKRLDAAWAVGTNQGGLDTGSIANTTYHMWLIRRPDTGVVDVLFSASATAPTMPANYTQKRRIGSIIRNAGAIHGFKQDGDYFALVTPVLDVSVANPGTSAVTRTLTVPIGIRVSARIAMSLNDTSGAVIYCRISDLSNTDLAASSSNYDIFCLSGGSSPESGIVEQFTSTSAGVRSRISASVAGTSLGMLTLGWRDQRGRDS